MGKIKYIEYTDKLCFKCLKESEKINTYELSSRGYGSDFDNFGSKLQLCEECSKDIHKDLTKWFNESPNFEDDYYEDYKYEKNIYDFIKTLPIQGIELFDNQISYGACAYSIDSQDYIDMELGVASDEIYNKNNRYSPSEIKAYNERFPTCKNTYLKMHKDGSGGTRCRIHMGTCGNKDGSCGINISDSCYRCDFYEKRDFNKDKMKIDKTLNVDYKIIEIVESFCPTCGHKNQKYKTDIIYKYEEEFDCDKCGQSLFINADELLGDE